MQFINKYRYFTKLSIIKEHSLWLQIILSSVWIAILLECKMREILKVAQSIILQLHLDDLNAFRLEMIL